MSKRLQRKISKGMRSGELGGSALKIICGHILPGTIFLFWCGELTPKFVKHSRPPYIYIYIQNSGCVLYTSRRKCAFMSHFKDIFSYCNFTVFDLTV